MGYPNMNYCAARNTLAAIEQLITILEEGDIAELEREEYRAVNEIIDAARYLSELAAEKVDDFLSIKIDD
jgi:hypothetical protein